MDKFGQEVIVSIRTSENVSILEATGLRVDFDVRQEPGFSRATVTIFNLNSETIGNLIGGNNDHYITLTTVLHGRQSFVLMDRFFISNAVDEKLVPNTITTLYCHDRNKKVLYENQVNTFVEKPTLTRQLDTIIKSNPEVTGQLTWLGFPKGLKDEVPLRPRTNLNGSVSNLLDDLSREYNFEYYSSPDGGLTLVYKPTAEQVQAGLTDFQDRDTVKLSTDNMRSNPKLGFAQIAIDSNLDGDIHPGALVDINNLLTAGVSVDEKTLQLTQNALSAAVAGIGLYQIIMVNHKGSNYTDEWNTLASGVAPTKGQSMNVGRATWFKNNPNN